MAKKLGFKLKLAKPREPRWKKNKRQDEFIEEGSSPFRSNGVKMNFIMKQPRINWETDIR